MPRVLNRNYFVAGHQRSDTLPVTASLLTSGLWYLLKEAIRKSSVDANAITLCSSYQSFLTIAWNVRAFLSKFFFWLFCSAKSDPFGLLITGLKCMKVTIEILLFEKIKIKKTDLLVYYRCLRSFENSFIFCELWIRTSWFAVKWVQIEIIKRCTRSGTHAPVNTPQGYLFAPVTHS